MALKQMSTLTFPDGQSFEIFDKVARESIKEQEENAARKYAQIVCLTSDGATIKNSAGKVMTFAEVQTTVSASTNHVLVVYNAHVLHFDAKSASAITFVGVREAGGKYYSSLLTITSDGKVTFKEGDLALTGDVIKNLSGMAEDATHRVVTDAQIKSWSDNVTAVANMVRDIKAGTIETAEWHLGFYLDENGDLCQKED